MNRILAFLALLAGAALALPAAAVQWNSSSAGSATACAGGTLCQMAMTSSDGSALVSAYSTTPAQAGGGTTAGNWVEANLFKYGGGFGISNAGTGDSGESGTPEHAIDNANVLDILVIELPTLPAGMVWDFTNFMLGWAEENGSSNRWADISMFIGGSSLGSGYDFRDVCFTGCTGGAATLASLGFADVTSAITNPAGSAPGNACAANSGGFNVCEGVTASINTDQTGKYLVVAGKLGDQYDAFKFDMLKAVKTPVPGTLTLLGLGLFGLVALRRRPKSA